jgi:hypothetical protein
VWRVGVLGGQSPEGRGARLALDGVKRTATARPGRSRRPTSGWPPARHPAPTARPRPASAPRARAGAAAPAPAVVAEPLPDEVGGGGARGPVVDADVGQPPAGGYVGDDLGAGVEQADPTGERAACGFRNRDNYRRRVQLHCTRQTRRLSAKNPTVPA